MSEKLGVFCTPERPELRASMVEVVHFLKLHYSCYSGITSGSLLIIGFFLVSSYLENVEIYTRCRYLTTNLAHDIHFTLMQFTNKPFPAATQKVAYVGS